MVSVYETDEEILLPRLRQHWYATGKLGCYLCCAKLPRLPPLAPDGLASICVPCEDELMALRAADPSVTWGLTASRLAISRRSEA